MPEMAQGLVALVTGASSGIGAAVARRLARGGVRVALAARRRDRLDELASEIARAGGKACAFPVDLTQEKGREQLVEEVAAVWGTIDILVNNAGLGWYGYGCEMPWSRAREMIEVNGAAAVHLSLLVLPQMKHGGWGHIVNIGSIAGDIPSQGVALYCATKSFLEAFTTALHRELRGTGVHVSLVKPGPVATEFFDCSSCAGLRMPAERFAVSPARVAESVWHLLQHPRRAEYVPGWYRIVPWVELAFGWIMDRLGPLLLRRQAQIGNATHS
ncbi:MAG: SDR family NAD(P)-dependent oxidoreductase [Chloroflexia bacterium]